MPPLQIQPVPLSSIPPYSTSSSSPNLASSSPFPISNSANTKIKMHRGNVYSVQVDAALIATNESFSERGGEVGEIWKHLGKDLERECQKADKVRTGEVCLTSAGNLPCKRLLHTVGPRYNEQYRTAAENALHFCYRNSLRMLKEESLKTLALTCVYTKRKRYPRPDAAHIVCRTVRRFLERFGDSVDSLVFCFDDDEDEEIYKQVLPLYFPRTEEELAHSIANLPKDVGNADGETVIAERKIRINSFPTAPKVSKALFEEKASKLVGGFAEQEALVQLDRYMPKVAGFAQMVPDQDEIRKANVQKQLKNMNKSERGNLRYERMLRDSRLEDLSDIAKLGFIYKSGRDINGRTIIVIVARHLPAKAIDMNRVLLYIIRVMDSIVEREYSIVYVHSTMQSQNQPELSWMQEVTAIFNRKYKKNLKRFFVVHPTFWVKMVFWALSPIISDKFWMKLKYVSELSELEKYLELDKLGLPSVVVDYDRKRSGSSASGLGGSTMPPEAPERVTDITKGL
ncbi:hypothetical protein TrLO_g6860 [Triparma laevis f. longispina]|uniref:Uncharacterized protein n=1 Tax=Triparma laevis f. longispina TaxID=1714387 RepID=A0A9W7CDJ2_9STRA|nr:hypothetical protein TrLO_g6860 [Triparma laevis f. longispina]